MDRIFRLFESWLDPFRKPPADPLPPGVLAFLMFFARQARWLFVLMLVLGGLMAGVEAAIYAFVGVIVDLLETSSREGFFEANWPLLLGMAATVLILRSAVVILTALLEEQAVVPSFFNLVRWQAHNQVMRQGLGYFHDDFSGRISAKVWQAGQSAGEFMITLLQTIWYIVVYALTTLALVSQLDIRLGAIIAVWLLCFAALARYFVPRIRAYAKQTAHKASGVTGRLVDTYTNIQTVKLFGSPNREEQGSRDSFEQFLDQLRQFTRTLTSVRSSMALLNGVMIVLIAGGALLLWQSSAISTGDVAFTLGLVLRLNLLLNRMLGQLNGLFRNIGTLQDSVEMIVKPIAVKDRIGAQELSVTDGAISFSGIRFHYGKDGGVIDDLTLAIKPGERLGIVGPSGAGKSTLVNLLLRFYDLEAGRISIDGQNVADVTQHSLRAHVGLVTQDTALLHRSIRENICYGNPEATEEAIVAAARDAHAIDFIESLTDRQGRKAFDARVGERGVKLSGGQRQRIAIARVLLKNAPILVLDEATSALDSEIEAAIQENLTRLMTGKTVIAIAHRLSTIAQMDRLVVMDKGRIAETGTHEDLLAANGLYADLWRRQSGGFLNPDRKSGTDGHLPAPL